MLHSSCKLLTFQRENDSHRLRFGEQKNEADIDYEARMPVTTSTQTTDWDKLLDVPQQSAQGQMYNTIRIEY